MAAFAALLDDDVVWHEVDAWVRGLLPRTRRDPRDARTRVLRTGVELKDLSIRKVFADDDHAVVLLAITMTRGDREHTSEYVDVYSMRAGKVAEHRHLPVDPNAEEHFFAV
jgi:hypothetical protein